MLINENLIYKNCPTLLASSIEYQGIKSRSNEMTKQLNKIRTDDATKELIPKVTGKLAEILNQPTLCIILAYMLRMVELDDSLKEDLNIILSKATYLVEMMLQTTNMMRMEAMMGNRAAKRITGSTIQVLIQFSQNLV